MNPQGYDSRAGQGTMSGTYLPAGTAITGNGRVQIPALLDEQAGALAELHKCISEFEQRLSLVLAHNAPADINKEAMPTPSQITDRVQYANSLIANASNRLRDLMQRLAL